MHPLPQIGPSSASSFRIWKSHPFQHRRTRGHCPSSFFYTALSPGVSCSSQEVRYISMRVSSLIRFVFPSVIRSHLCSFDIDTIIPHGGHPVQSIFTGFPRKAQWAAVSNGSANDLCQGLQVVWETYDKPAVQPSTYQDHSYLLKTTFLDCRKTSVI